MLALHNNYDGKSEGERKKQVDKDDLKILFYSKNHFSFWEKFNQDEKTFNVLDNYIVPLYE